MNWQTPSKTERIKIDDLSIYPGECFTLWMNKNPRSAEREEVQVELRITPDGKPQIFTNLVEVQIVGFKNWTLEPQDGAGEGK